MIRNYTVHQPIGTLIKLYYTWTITLQQQINAIWLPIRLVDK